MTKAHSFIISALAVMLSGCAGMNSDFEFDKPAKDSGVWMSQADDMSAGSSGNAPSAASAAGGFITLAAERIRDQLCILASPNGLLDEVLPEIPDRVH